jgi:Protein of unknown function (DUF3892)
VPHAQTIRCVTRGLGRLPHERIRSVGGSNADGSRWKQSQEQTIKEIESGAWEFFAQIVWRRERVTVATYYGGKYLKAGGDDLQPDALLSLPECP